MAKRYKVSWGQTIVIGACRGKKQVKDHIRLETMDAYVEQILLPTHLQALRGMDGEDIEQLRAWCEQLREGIRKVKKNACLYHHDVVYCMHPTLNMQTIQDALTLLQRETGVGTYHLSDEGGWLIRKGQRCVPKGYRERPWKKRDYFFLRKGYQKWKSELRLYVSEAEFEDTMILLAYLHGRPRAKTPKWAVSLLEERVDYVKRCVSPNMSQFFYLHIVGTS